MPFLLTMATDGKDQMEIAINPDLVFAVGRSKNGTAEVMSIAGARISTTVKFDEFLEAWAQFDDIMAEENEGKPEAPLNVEVKL